jgi:hypothetical protein
MYIYISLSLFQRNQDESTSSRPDTNPVFGIEVLLLLPNQIIESGSDFTPWQMCHTLRKQVLASSVVPSGTGEAVIV